MAINTRKYLSLLLVVNRQVDHQNLDLLFHENVSPHKSAPQLALKLRYGRIQQAQSLALKFNGEN